MLTHALSSVYDVPLHILRCSSRERSPTQIQVSWILEWRQRPCQRRFFSAPLRALDRVRESLQILRRCGITA